MSFWRLMTVSGCMSDGISEDLNNEHNLDNESAATLSAPGICSTSKLYSWISHFQCNTLEDASLFTNNKFLWSVLIRNLTSLKRYWNFLIDWCIAYPSFSKVDQSSWAPVKALLWKPIGYSLLDSGSTW